MLFSVKCLLLLVSFGLLVIVQSKTRFHKSNCAENRVAIVHLFEWKWSDVAKECERFLGPRGYCGVQISPPNEHVIITNPWRPWYERYQPISYKLTSRSGDEAAFINMVHRCNRANVRIYVDAVINHMAGKGQTGTGSAGSQFNSGRYEFPAVPFSSWDFNGPNGKCNTRDGNINNYHDVNQVRNCDLVSLVDLDLSKDYVRTKIAEYLNRLIDIGVAGFRVDASKHMWPQDLEAIENRLKNLNTQFFPANSKPFIFHEVIDQGNEPIKASHYAHLGRVQEFRYCVKIRDYINSNNLAALRNVYDPGWGMLPSEDAFIFVDNHDNQRGHGGGGSVLTFKDPKKYKMAVAFTFANDYGFPQIMSSFDFSTDSQGPPNNNGNTKDVLIRADGSCGDGWICEHRWSAIAAMAGFSKAVSGTKVQNWWSQGGSIAFSRGNKGFFAMSSGSGLDTTIYTGLPAGSYCNVISGLPNSNGCSGDTVTVNDAGMVRVQIKNNNEPMFAIHVEARAPTSSGRQRTAILLKRITTRGENLFIRGGIDDKVRQGCTTNAHTSKCALDISVHSLGINGHYNDYNTWRVGDHKLDWYGREATQHHTAEGTPLVWTTNDQRSAGFQQRNKLGEHYWLVEFDMDCSQTVNGWFELKGFLKNSGNGLWENNIRQQSCTGSAGASNFPYASNNHFAKCGFLNIFEFNSNSCVIERM